MRSPGKIVNVTVITAWRQLGTTLAKVQKVYVVRYVNVESLHCTPEADIIVCVNYSLIKNSSVQPSLPAFPPPAVCAAAASQVGMHFSDT